MQRVVLVTDFFLIFFWGGDKVGVQKRDFNNSSSIFIIKFTLKYFHNDDVFADYS